MSIVLNIQLPADLSMTDTHLLSIAESINTLFSCSKANTNETIFILKERADRLQLVDHYRVVKENKWGKTTVADWGNAECTQIALLAIYNAVQAMNL